MGVAVKNGSEKWKGGVGRWKMGVGRWMMGVGGGVRVEDRSQDEGWEWEGSRGLRMGVGRK